jgi:hypothetical protein
MRFSVVGAALLSALALKFSSLCGLRLVGMSLRSSRTGLSMELPKAFNSALPLAVRVYF